MKKTWIIVLVVVVVIIVGIILGLSIYGKNKTSKNNIVENEIKEVSEKITDDCVEEYKKIQEEAKAEIETTSNEEKISPNCLITLKRHYNECQHTINEYIDIPKDLVNKTQEDLKKEYQNWEIEKYSNTQIVLYKEFDSSCGQHFILRNDNGKITVYRINENNEEEIYQKTEIAIDYLTEADKVEIQNGIKVNGIEELNQLIEDFE